MVLSFRHTYHTVCHGVCSQPDIGDTGTLFIIGSAKNETWATLAH